MLPRRGQAVCHVRGEDPRGQDASLIPLRHKSKTPGTDMTAMPSVSVARRQNGNMWRFCAGWGARFVRSAKIIGEIGAARATKEKPLSAGPVMGAGKERYRLLAGRPTWKTTPGQNRFKKQNSYENVRKPSSEPQARPADNNPGHLLRQLGGRAIASKRRQAHARVAHCNGCLTGAVAAAPPVGEPAHHPLDQTGFYGFGQTLKPAVCEKCRNPKSSDNAAPARRQRMIAGLCL